MTNEELINNEKYHTCGRCKHKNTPDGKYPCIFCIYGTDHRTDLWELEQQSEYEDGLNDAWECVKKIYKMNFKTRKEILGVNPSNDSLTDIINAFPASEAISKIKEYEEKAKQANDEIKVGDEVYLSSLSKDYPRIVLSLYAEDDGLGLKARTMLSSGTIDIKPISEFKKTGRHFDQIAEVLKQLKEGEK